MLEHHAQRYRLRLYSQLDERINPVGDALLRHCEQSTAAVSRPGVAQLSYYELAQLVEERARYFARRGLKPGTLVALIVRDPFVLICGALAAWKLGAIVSFIEPRGHAYIRTRLDILAPELIATDDLDDDSLEGWPSEQCIAATGRVEGPVSDDAHIYTPDDEIARLFSPLSPSPSTPISLSAQAWLAGTIREGIIILDLAPNQSMSAPSLELQRYEPCLWSSVCVAGAMRLTPKDRSLRTQEAFNADVIGLTKADVEAWVSGALPLQRAKRWFWPISEPLDVLALQRAASALQKARLPGVFTLGVATAGGTFAWSPKPDATASLEMMPAPGLPHALATVGSPELKTDGPGILTTETLAPHAMGSYIFGHHDGQMYCAGAASWTRGGAVFPTEEIEAVASATPGIESAITIVGPGTHPNDGRLHLLLFVDPRGPWPINHEATINTVHERLLVQLGASTPLPDRIEVFPLVIPGHPDPDRSRCAYEYLAGLLHRRRNDPLFRELARLRRTLLDWQATDTVSS